jgi:hypothetical protein
LIQAVEDKLELIAAGEAVAIVAEAFRGTTLHPGITAIPLEDVEPSHVVLATRAGERNRLVSAFTKIARTHLTPAAHPQ